MNTTRRSIITAAPVAALAVAVSAPANATDPIFNTLDVDGLISRARLVGMVPYVQRDGKVGMVCGEIFDQLVTAGRITFGCPLPVIEPGDPLPVSGMADAIERHRVAWERFGAAVTACDRFEPGYDPSAAEANELIYNEANDAERAALWALAELVPLTLEDVRARAAYLAAHAKRNQLLEEHWQALMESTAAAGSVA
jgi:hypothetical protein